MVSVGIAAVIYQNFGDPSIEYIDNNLNGNLLSIDYINTLISPPFVIPSGKIQIGWTYIAAHSSSADINGSPAIDGTVYPVGASYSTTGTLTLYPAYGDAVCFLEGTPILGYDKILEKECYRPIETLRQGDLIKVYKQDEYREIEMIGYPNLQNRGDSKKDKNRLYHLSPKMYPDLLGDVYVTGSHAVLVDTLTFYEESEIKSQFGRLFVTDDKYR